MIDAETYRRRRQALIEALGDGVVLLQGHNHVPRNYPQNWFPFRQNSHVLYYAGINEPGLALVLDCDSGEESVFGSPEDLDDVVWYGPRPTLAEQARSAGIQRVQDIAGLPALMASLAEQDRDLHFLPPYQFDLVIWMAELLGTTPDGVVMRASQELVRAIAAQRSLKSDDEVAEIEEALGVTRRMHLAAMRAARPGVRESDVAAAVQQIALAEDRAQSYNPIVSVRGEVLHNNTYDNVLEPGQMLLNDSGAESPRFYASDITRCCPIGGRFTPEQKGVYDAVLAAQHAAIQAIRPGVRFKDIHLAACRVMVEGLCEVGLMSGDPAEAVTAGAHALFFPHGLGHMLGLDVHDMEDLGDVVGYPEGAPRSTQFGLNFLRLSRELEPGFVFTIEPGCYFIPALIDRWRELRLHREFIRYERLESFRNFGGIRIEDDLLCTEDGYRILGEPIPKSPEEVEAAMAS